MRELLETVREWQADGALLGRAVVVRTFGSAPRPEGATLVVTSDGRLAGSVSGGCVEGAAYEEIQAARAAGVSRVIRYGISDEQAWDVGLACGGTIDVLVEPYVRPEVLAAAAGSTGSVVVIPLPADAPGAAFGPHPPGPGEPPGAALRVADDGSLGGSTGSPEADEAIAEAARRLLSRGGSATVTAAGRQFFLEGYPSAPRLVVVGAVQVAMPLVRMARELGYLTVVVDGRETFATAARFPDVDRLVVGWLDEVADEIGLGPGDAVAVLSHDGKFDEPAIVEALRRGCRYVGAIRVAQDPGGASREAPGGGRGRRRAGPAARTDRAGPRWARACRDGARDHGRDRRRSARRLGRPDARPGGGGRARVIAARDVAAVILAAGVGSRFGGGKVRAALDGLPLVAHVLAAVRAAGIGRVVVVLGRDATGVLDAVREAAPGALEQVIVAVNPAPERGLAASLRLGFGVATAAGPDGLPPGGVLVLLGDQPRVRADVLRLLLEAPAPADAVALVPRYAEDAASNPVLLLPGGWPLVAGLSGDRGLGQLLAADPARVVGVAVPGANPDVDTPADLAALGRGAESLMAAWAARVRANRDAGRAGPRGAGRRRLLRPGAGHFVDDPHRSGDAILDALDEIARPDETWLDIGAGAGRYALPLALRVREVIAVDPSEGMLGELRDGMQRHGIGNVRVIHGRWPLDPDAGRLAACRCRAHRPSWLRHRGNRGVPGHDGGRRRPAVRRDPGGARALDPCRPVLAGRPR